MPLWWPSSSAADPLSHGTVRLLGQEAHDIGLDARHSVWCQSTAAGEPLGYLAQKDGGCVIPSDWEGRHDGGPEGISLGGETLLGIDEVTPLPQLAE
jgi:hypothetical protein